LGMYLMADAWWMNLGTWLAFLKAAVGLGVVIFVHELGHFLVAKACGVKCEKFYVGFDVPIRIGPLVLPRALLRKRWGETEYGIGIIPLGGYVKMLGQDDNPAHAAAEAERIRVAGQSGAGTGGEAPASELDPRSYPAKSVPKRMAIISAGVVFNLIFAVIFATIAYLMGVSYIPCIIGGTMAGDPAWIAALQPGDKVIQLGPEGRRDEDLRFTKDLRLKVFAVGEGNDLPLLVRQPATGQEQWITVRPNAPLRNETGLPTIGVLAASSPVLAGDFSPWAPGGPAPGPALRAGDRIVAVEVDGQQHVVDRQVGVELMALLSRFRDQPLTLIAERSADGDAASPAESLRVELPPQPVMELGMAMRLGPITAVQAGSPAETAGLQAGDLITHLDGQDVGNPMTLSDRLRGRAGEQITLGIARPSESGIPQTMQLTVTARAVDHPAPSIRAASPVAISELGVACNVAATVQSVETGGPADQAGIRPGDEIVSVELLGAAGEKADTGGSRRTSSPPLNVSREEPNWPLFHTLLQMTAPGEQVRVTYRREGKRATVTLQPQPSRQWHTADRGLFFRSASDIQRASSLGSALHLGWRETKEGLLQVLLVLRRIKDSFRSLGGPGTIAVAATMEASEGLARLLVFLTLLSANLAILNFLPIPVLDGGHMMFLIYEGIRGKPVNERLAFGLTVLGLSFILGLMIFVIGLDIYRFAA